jgi:pilus assembly protein CpaD
MTATIRKGFGNYRMIRIAMMTHSFRLMALGLVGLAATACTAPMANTEEHAVVVDRIYPITVEPQVATLAINVDDGMQSIARGEDERIRAFVERWKDRGQGQLNAATPTGGQNQAAAWSAMEKVKKVLSGAGVPRTSVQFTSYRAAEGDEQAPITLSFVTYAAVAPECGTDWSENLGYTPRNLPWPEFGCSTQHNFAAVISDPRDLVEPRASESTDAARRSTVLEKYRKGETTGAASSNGADSGAVSKVGAN